MMKRIAAGFACLSMLGAVPAAAVTFGSPDSTHTHVGTILFRTATGLYSCSGTMLSPTVMLTAGHCTEEAGVTNPKTWVKFDQQISVATGCAASGIPPADIPACQDAWLDDPSHGWIQASAHPHPNYDDFAQFPATYDVGIVVLSAPVSPATFGTLPPLNFLNTIKKAKDDSFTVVGYGQQGDIPAFYSNLWERRQGKVRLLEVNSTFNGGMSAKFSSGPGIGGGSCYGDSGGPVFYKDTNVVVAVVSFGFTPCIGTSYEFRTDLPDVQSFVSGFLNPQ